MKPPAHVIRDRFPSVWSVECDPTTADGVLVRVHANPRTEICDVTLSRLIAALWPNVSYVLCVVYHWAERRLERLLCDPALDML